MTRIIWDEASSRTWEHGVSQGILYTSDGAAGVAWNGLISVTDSSEARGVLAASYDGAQYLNTSMNSVFKASITAFSYPLLFSACVGEIHAIPGLIFPNQVRTSFGLCYRTEVSDGYKLHLVYNAKASRSAGAHSTLNNTVTPDSLGFNISVNAVTNALVRNTGHYILDSRTIGSGIMAEIEDVLYGTESTDPSLPQQDAILAVLTSIP